MNHGDSMKHIQDFFNEIKNIEYGWHDKDGHIHESLKGAREGMILQDSETIVEDNHAVCWEMCELQREFFKRENIDYKNIFVYLNNPNRYAYHTFSIFQHQNRWYWLEASWINKKGIHEFTSIKEIFDYFRNNFEDFARGEYDPKEVEFLEYDDVKAGMNTTEFVTQCLKGKKVEE